MTSNERMNQRVVISRLRFFVPIAIRPLCLFVAVAALALVQLTPPASALPPYTVTKTADTNDGSCDLLDCSLREAVRAVNAGGVDVIIVPAGTYNLTIAGAGEDASATGDLDLTADVTITGAGAGSTVIDASTLGDRVLHVLAGVTAQVSGVTISGGTSSDGAGIYNDGTLTLSSDTVSGNSTNNVGGGIVNNGALTINDSTISSNVADLVGGISSAGSLSIYNSTISGNSAPTGVGGMYNGGALTVNSSTISGNTDDSGDFADGIHTSGSSTSTLKNTVLDNGVGGNCTAGITSAGHNLSSDASCAFAGTGDQNSTDPMLGPLASNGGPTQTHALGAGSPAIDAGSCTDTGGSPVTADQRGVPRPQGTACDIGAFELEAPGHDLFEATPTTFTFGIPASFFNPGSDPFAGPVSLRGQAIDSVNLGTTDMIIKRRHAPDLSGVLPSTDTVPIEIVALSLVSTNPITVTYFGGGSPEMWNVGVGLSPVTQPLGTMPITKQNASGGTFDASLPVQARLTFTRVSDSAVRTLNAPTATFNESGGPWRLACPPIVLVAPGWSTPNYCAGTDGASRVPTTWAASFGQIAMLPACADNDGGDRICTTVDNCPNAFNANQANADGDAFGNVCDPCANDMANDVDLDGICVGPGFMLPNQGGNDNCPTVANTGQQNADGDAWGDACDGCPSTVTSWATPPGDADCDAFPSFTNDPGTNRASEFFFLGTDPDDACADTTTPNDERGPAFSEAVSPWPMDNNDDRAAGLSDILAYIPVFGTTGPGLPYKARYDLNANNNVGLSDILMYIPFFGLICTP